MNELTAGYYKTKLSMVITPVTLVAQAEDPITVLNNDYIPALPLTSLGKSL